MNKIPAAATVRALDATAFLNWEYGLTFNGLITVNFEALGATTERDANKVLTSMNEAVSDKLARHCFNWKFEFPYVFQYVHEDVPTSYGHHAHQLVCVPRSFGEFLDEFLKEWAWRNYRVPPDAGATDYRGGYPFGVKGCLDQQSRLLRYILKTSSNAVIAGAGGEPTTLHTILEANRHKRSYCAPVRKVLGSSQNLARKAQLQAGFQVPQLLETVFTEEYLRSWESFKTANDLHTQLAAINL